MTTRLCACAFLLMAAQVTACGGDDGDGNNNPVDAGGSIDATPPDAGLSAEVEALCNTTDGIFIQFFSRFFECNPFFELVFNSTPDAEDFRVVCVESLAPFIDDGTVMVPSDVSACTDYIANTSCELFDPDVNPCTSIIVGTVADGDDCDSDDQCAGDAYCMDAVAAADCGSCTAALADGAACDDNEQCIANYCRVDGTCGAKNDVGGVCTGDDDCRGQLACDTEASLCVSVPPFAVNDACDGQEPFEQCGFPISGLYCGSDTNLCRAELDVGGSCDNMNFCHLAQFEWCDAGTCAAPAIANDGEACGIAINTEANRCAPGLRCSNAFGGGGTCFMPQQDGEACNDEGTPMEACDLFLECIDSVCAYSEYSGECPAP